LDYKKLEKFISQQQIINKTKPLDYHAKLKEHTKMTSQMKFLCNYMSSVFGDGIPAH